VSYRVGMVSGAARYDGHSECDRRLEFLPGYGHVGWANRGSGDGTGLGGRVGFHHKTLASFLGAIARYAQLCLNFTFRHSGHVS
jgi:hypothetical protein